MFGGRRRPGRLSRGQAQYHSVTRRFLGLEYGPPIHPQLQRLATWTWVQAVGHRLRVLTGAGTEQVWSCDIVRFQMAAPAHQHVYTWLLADYSLGPLQLV